jgi:GH24 family phage-related lysozyme (muramidase)
MRTSSAGTDLIKEFEGLRLEAYLCPADVLTIGYGHTDAAGPPNVRRGMRITKAEADHILEQDLIKYEKAVDRLVKVPLTQNQFDALVSFAFNCGTGALEKSTLLRRLNRGEYDAVPPELMKWNKAGGRELTGLTRRRRAEAKLWRGLDTNAPIDTSETRSAPDKPQPKKRITESREANTAAITGATATLAALGEASGSLKSMSDNFQMPIFIVLVAIAVACGLIWWFRKQRLEETGE